MISKKSKEELLKELDQLKKENEILRKSEQRYHQLVDRAAEAIVVIQNGKIQFCNPMTENLTGYSEEELFSNPFPIFIHPEDRTMVVNNHQRRLKGENVPGYYIFRLLRKDDNICWVYMNSVLIEWEGQPATLSFLTDITASKQIEEALQQSNKRLEAIISATPDGIGIISLDGILLFVSDKLVEMYGYSAKEKDGFLGRQSLDFIDPANHELLVGNINKLVSGNGDYKIKEYLAVKKDNSRFYIEINYTVLYDSRGNPESILFVERDSTVRKQAEEELQQSKRKLEAIISATPDGIGVMTLDGKLQLMSDKLVIMYGYPIEEKDNFIGRQVLDFIDPSDHKKAFENIQKLLIGERDDNLSEYLAIKMDGSRFHIDLNSTLLRDTNGNPTGILFVERDITERKRAEAEIKLKNEQLMTANAEKDKFFSIVAHDLKSPFQGLMGLTEILAIHNQELSAEDITEFSNSLHKSVVNLYKLLENLLEWALLQKGSIEFTPKELYLTEIFSHCVDSIKHRAIQKGIAVKTQIPEALKICADEKMITSVLRNLLSNAIKFTNRGGKISVNAEEIENRIIKISVTDTGVGVSDAAAGKLFKLGEKVGTFGTENEPSTGLGLLLCKEFVEKHGGTIWVESEEGEGSTFNFTLPAMQ